MPEGWCRRLAVALLLLLLAATLLLYRLCYSAPDTVACASGGGRLHFPHTQRRLPAAIIIGVRKGGTRALLEMINLHPQVRPILRLGRSKIDRLSFFVLR